MYEGDGRFPRIGGKRDISAYATLKMSTDEVPPGARFDYWIETADPCSAVSSSWTWSGRGFTPH